MIGKTGFGPVPFATLRTPEAERPTQRKFLTQSRRLLEILMGLLAVGAGDADQKFAFSPGHGVQTFGTEGFLHGFGPESWASTSSRTLGAGGLVEEHTRTLVRDSVTSVTAPGDGLAHQGHSHLNLPWVSFRYACS